MTLSPAVDRLTIDCTITAPSAQIYVALTTRDGLSGWLCDNAYAEAEIGRGYLVSWRRENYHVSGTFLTLEQDKQVAFTWRGKNETIESTVKILLEDHGDHTALTLTHDGLPDEAALEAYRREWESGLGKLRQYLESGALPNIVNRVIVGIRPAPVSVEQAQALGLVEGAGTLVNDLVPGFSAEKAGILAGDIITALDGKAVTAEMPMNILTQGRKPGEQIAVTFYRNGEQHTVSMQLKGYPVPPTPESFAALADQIEQEYSRIDDELAEIFAAVSAQQARQRPKAGEWSADHVLGHLIYSERYIHDELGARVTGGSPQHWAGNDDIRLEPLLDVHADHAALLAEFRTRRAETVAILRHFPAASATPVNLWGAAFSLDNWLIHTRGHYKQIREALAATAS